MRSISKRRSVPTEPVETPIASQQRHVIVAEIYFNRNASPEELRSLGEQLEACRETQKWITRISGLDALLRGECPEAYSKAIVNSETGKPLHVFYDPLLVWARVDYRGKETLDPIGILRAAISPTLSRVTFPDPDGGL